MLSLIMMLSSALRLRILPELELIGALTVMFPLWPPVPPPV